MREKLGWLGFLIGIAQWIAASFGAYVACSQLAGSQVPCDGPPVTCEDPQGPGPGNGR